MCCAILRWKVGALKFQESDDDRFQELEVILQSNDTPPLHPRGRKIKTKPKRSQAPTLLRGKAKVLPAAHQAVYHLPHHPPPILIFSHLPFSHLPSFTLLWPHWAPGCSLNNSGTLLPQGLCTGSSLCLQCSSLTIHLASSLPLSLCSNVTCSVTYLLTLLPKIAPNTLPACFIFLHHFHHYLAY